MSCSFALRISGGGESLGFALGYQLRGEKKNPRELPCEGKVLNPESWGGWEEARHVMGASPGCSPGTVPYPQNQCPPTPGSRGTVVQLYTHSFIQAAHGTLHVLSTDTIRTHT